MDKNRTNRYNINYVGSVSDFNRLPYKGVGQQKRVSCVKRSCKHNQNGRQGFMGNNAHLFMTAYGMAYMDALRASRVKDYRPSMNAVIFWDNHRFWPREH